VCPWNRKLPRTTQEEFQPRKSSDQENSLFYPKLEWLANLTEEEYRELFRGSAMKRAKLRGIIRNTLNAIGNSENGQSDLENEKLFGLLQGFAMHEDSGISESAKWAIARIKKN